MQDHKIGSKLTVDKIEQIVASKSKLEIPKSVADRVQACREYLDKKIKRSEDPIYGINTGFGSLHNISISDKDLNELQENLVKSHACGQGDEVSKEIVKIMLLLKIQGLSYGHSGVSMDTLRMLVEMYNHDILPVVYELGSLGASGDLAPLAHLCLPLIGLGEVNYKGKKKNSSSVLKSLGLKPVKLQSKEGLALLNGTQFMSSYGTWLLIKAKRLHTWANKIGALSLDAFDGRIEPFDDLIHQVRNHPTQISVAKEIRGYLKGSQLIKRKKAHVQDPYSFRCMPQVHGASLQAIQHFEQIIEHEINAVTDNPTIFWKEDKIISGGNFHGQPLAISLDYLSIALAELGSISERRIYKLVDGQRGLPSYLVDKPGLNSGYMILQYSAAAVVSQNKQYCMPASIDSIDSSQGQEDHVSMGANAATKAKKVLDNLQRVLSNELMTACQALDFRRPLKSSKTLETVHKELRKKVPFIKKDVEMYKLMQKSLTQFESMI